MKILIAVVSCHQYRPRAQAQRETWAKNVQGADLRFFLGRGPKENDDEVILDVGDGYRELPAKTQALCRWASEQGYDFLFKCDDDTYVQVERLLASGFEAHDYVGRVRGPSGIFPAPYCSGFGYWLSAKAMKIVADAPLNGDDAEDRFVANALLPPEPRKHEIWGHPDYRYAVVTSQRNQRSAQEGPRQGNQIIAACEFPPAEMHQVHQHWLTVPSRIIRRHCSGTLSKVAILIKTFLRDGYLIRCVTGIERTLPEVKMVIVDDGYEARKITLYARLRDLGHTCIWLPFDSGFGAKGNAGIPGFSDHQYVLIASDDFDFEPPNVRAGIEKMVTVLDHDPSIHIVSGRVNGRTYESCLEIEGSSVREVRGHRQMRSAGSVVYKTCDLTVNYSLIRTSCFGPEKLHWDGKDVKIGGGEHGAFYYDAKKLGYGVAVIEDVSISEYPQDFSQMHPMYSQMRRRAQQPGRACLRARGIEKWGLQDGSWENC